MAEVHVVGQLVGATGFKERNLFCKVRVVRSPGPPLPRSHGGRIAQRELYGCAT